MTLLLLISDVRAQLLCRFFRSIQQCRAANKFDVFTIWAGLFAIHIRTLSSGFQHATRLEAQRRCITHLFARTYPGLLSRATVSVNHQSNLTLPNPCVRRCREYLCRQTKYFSLQHPRIKRLRFGKPSSWTVWHFRGQNLLLDMLF